VRQKTKRNHMTGKILIWLLTTFLLENIYAEAQQPTKIPRIGFLVTTDRDAPNIEPFRQGLRELGYIEGQNILVEYRYAEGKNERFPSLVAELVRLKVDAIVSGNNSAVLSAKQLTKAIPVVMVLQQDPVGWGWSITWHVPVEISQE
jgi:putative tryptophan/tyrosine transport system substrate-binding protein